MAILGSSNCYGDSEKVKGKLGHLRNNRGQALGQLVPPMDKSTKHSLHSWLGSLQVRHLALRWIKLTKKLTASVA